MARKKFGPLARQYGAGFWMPDAVYTRILGLAHHHKLVSRETFAFELSDWLPRDIGEHGDEILALVNTHIPQAPPAPAVGDDTPKAPATMTCSTCTAKGGDARGHRCKHFFF
jgi:hypothetical protein